MTRDTLLAQYHGKRCDHKCGIESSCFKRIGNIGPREKLLRLEPSRRAGAGGEIRHRARQMSSNREKTYLKHLGCSLIGAGASRRRLQFWAASKERDSEETQKNTAGMHASMLPFLLSPRDSERPRAGYSVNNDKSTLETNPHSICFRKHRGESINYLSETLKCES